MAAIPVVFVGMDGNGNPTTLTGVLAYSDRGVGGGPIVPPDKPPGGPPNVIWPNPPEGQAPLPSHPISLPGDPWWPGEAPKPPELPPPGSPPVMIPGTQPVHPITPPPAIVVDYPGIGKVLVPQPLS